MRSHLNILGATIALAALGLVALFTVGAAGADTSPASPGALTGMPAACSAYVSTWPNATGRSNQPRGPAVNGVEPRNNRRR